MSGGRTGALRSLAVCSAFAAALYGTHVTGGGRYLDDWWLGAYVRFPTELGFANSADYLTFYSGARPGAVAYWLATYELFGFHDDLHRALNVALAALLGATFYVLLRELRFARLDAAAAVALSLVLPVADSIRFWMTPGVAHLCLAACAGGFILALRALRTGDRRLHAASLALFATSALLAETMLPIIGLSLIVYRTQVALRPALRRWALDAVLVVVAAAQYAVSTPERTTTSAGLDGYLDHARVLGDQALTLLTGTLVPLTLDRGWVVLGLLGLVAVALTRGGETARWLSVAGLAALLALASYAIYVPANASYQPLVPGVGNRVNIGALLPLCVLLVALARASGSVVPSRQVLAACVVLAVVLVGALGALRDDRRLWADAARQQRTALDALHTALPEPPRGAALIVLGVPGVVTKFERVANRDVNVPVPVFSTWWELDSAVKLSYGRADLAAYPIWSYQPAQAACGVRHVYQLGLDGVRHALAYGRVYVVDVAAVRANRLDSQDDCRRFVENGTTIRYDLAV
ncbi:MAG TPA: hypothetical protein VFZ89_13930 [Solirubrobacteraceae bacterium]